MGCLRSAGRIAKVISNAPPRAAQNCAAACWLVHRQLFEAADQLRRALQIPLNDLAALLQVLQVFGQGAAESGRCAPELALLGLHQRGGHGHSVANGRIQLVRHTRYQRS